MVPHMLNRGATSQTGLRRFAHPGRLWLSVFASFITVLPCGCHPRPNPTELGVREPNHVVRLQGTVVSVNQEQAIVGIDTPSGRTHTVRQAPASAHAERPGIWAIAGPDATGLVAFIEEHFPTPSYALKVIRLDGSQERTVFAHEGDPIWKRAVGKHTAISRTGGRLALVGQMRGVQMPMALLDEGPLEVWDIAKGTNVTCGQVLDQGIAWFPDGHRLACVRLLPRDSLSAITSPEDGFGKLFAHWDRVPVVCIVDVDTGLMRPICQGIDPVISVEGDALLVADFTTESGVHWRRIQIDTGTAAAVLFSSDRMYLAFDGSGSSLYLQPPTPGEPVDKTRYYSPLHGPSDLVTLRSGPIGRPTNAGDYIAGGFDPRNVPSFGVRSTVPATAPSEGSSPVDRPPAMSAMAYAAFDGNVDEVKRLAAKGESVNGQSGDVFTPLMWAASRGHEIVTLTLMQLGANPNLRNNVGHSALSEAARGCQLDVVKLLVAHGADVNAPDVQRVGGYTPLMYAAAHGCPGMCEYLLAHGANIGARDSSGNTAAQIAASHGDLPLSKWLAEQQARKAK